MMTCALCDNPECIITTNEVSAHYVKDMEEYVLKYSFVVADSRGSEL